MYAIGYDIGSSFVKCSVLNIKTGATVTREQYPDEEMPIISLHPGWAEQDPNEWWNCVNLVTRKILSKSGISSGLIRCIGISYQMHGLVAVDAQRRVVRPSIIWCDSRAVEMGNKAIETIGSEYCLNNLLNSPGNFTASKLAWIQKNESKIYSTIDKIMLPGDYIAMKLTDETYTTQCGLSEGIFWDFQERNISRKVMEYFGFRENMIPQTVPTFSFQGKVSAAAAAETGLPEGIPVSYRAGDQPNNAFSLNVLNAGEIAATAGTSGVVYAVQQETKTDHRSRVNQFLHVNNAADDPRIGVLLCINGTGIANSWMRKIAAPVQTYDQINAMAASVPCGSDGVCVLPFGNGAERMFENAIIGAHVFGLNFNRHTQAHLLRAVHEGIAYAFKYGITIITGLGIECRIIKASRANLFLSPIFRETIANCVGAVIELYDTDGAIGAARGAAVGAGLYDTVTEAFTGLARREVTEPDIYLGSAQNESYDRWLKYLEAVSEPKIGLAGKD